MFWGDLREDFPEVGCFWGTSGRIFVGFFVDFGGNPWYYTNYRYYINYINMITTLKVFGTGQITLPKAWRKQYKTDHFVAQDTPQGLLIKPLVDVFYYEDGDDHFGLSFPLGIDAKELARNLEKANGEV